MAQAVAAASSLIHLEKIKQLSLLEGPSWRGSDPSSGRARDPERDSPRTSHVDSRPHPQPIDPPSIAVLSLGPGESEAMALALERQIPWVILDDLAARQLGRSLGLEIVGTGAVLYKAKLKGLIPAVRPRAFD